MMIYYVVYRIAIKIVYPVFVLLLVVFCGSSEMENANQLLLLSQHTRHPSAFFAICVGSSTLQIHSRRGLRG